MKLYLIRHGETDLNHEKILQGQSDIPLNEHGRALARQTAIGLKDVPFDAIFTSPLSRAKETAEIIRGSRPIPLFEEPRIGEISFGDFEMLCYHPARYNIPDPAFLNFFNSPAEYQAPPNGETFEDILRRTDEFLRELRQTPAYAEKTLLLSTHGCALKALLANIQNLPIEAFWGEGVHPNCAVTIVEIADEEARVLEEGKIFYS